MRYSLSLIVACHVLPWLGHAAAPARPPNIVVILSDDQGYADLSFNPHHPKEVSTPNLDALARESIFFSQGYISGNVCSPTRAGLMTGRYQQRAGVYTAGEGGRGIALTEKIFPQFLKPAGYVSGAFGKWHLGLTPEQGPIGRGFDESYGFLGRGGHDYFKLDDRTGPEAMPIYRNREAIADQGYLTTRLTDEAVSFIQKHRAKHFYVHLAYNAVHAPAQAPEEDNARFRKQFPDLPESRVVLMAMLHHLDAGVGRVVETLKREGLWENTLLFFLTDNGGARAMDANNAPLRGFKAQHYEGGVRTPFMVSWPARFKGGRTIDVPVVSLDVLPTALDAAGVASPAEKPFDGKSLLSLLTGQTRTHHRDLFWSEGGATGEWAVRSENWKLIVTPRTKELYQLGSDPAEKVDLANTQADKVTELTKLYDAWLEQMAEPMSGDGKRFKSSGPDAAPKKQARKEKQAKRKQGGL
jgi:arylsulfatase A-like enzyme